MTTYNRIGIQVKGNAAQLKRFAEQINLLGYFSNCKIYETIDKYIVTFSDGEYYPQLTPSKLIPKSRKFKLSTQFNEALNAAKQSK